MWGCPRDRLQNDTLNEQAFSSRYLCHSMWSQTHTNGIQYKISRMALKKNPGDSYRGASVKCDQMPLSNGAVTIKILEEGYVDRFFNTVTITTVLCFQVVKTENRGSSDSYIQKLLSSLSTSSQRYSMEAHLKALCSHLEKIVCL